MDTLSALQAASTEFTARAGLLADRWSEPTVCGDWTVTDLVDHVIGGSRMSVGLLAGASREDAIALVGNKDVGADRVAALHTSLDEQLAAFTGIDLAAVSVHHPALDMSGDQLLGFRTVDLALHAWDLARSLGLDEQLDDGVVEASWEFLQPIASIIGQLGMFGTGPSGDVPDTAPLQLRLIDLTGRRP